MDLSVIVPCHNLEDYIENLIETLENQKTNLYQVEYIFVLDDCTDKTKDIILQSNLINIHIIECNVHSCGVARNMGMIQATGDYFWFIDGDDWLLTNHAFITVLDLLKSEHYPYIQIDYSSNYKINYFSMVWQYVFSAEFLLGIKFPRFQPDEDVKFMQEVIHKLKESTGYPQPVKINESYYYYYFNRPGSTMNNFRKNEENGNFSMVRIIE